MVIGYDLREITYKVVKGKSPHEHQRCHTVYEKQLVGGYKAIFSDKL